MCSAVSPVVASFFLRHSAFASSAASKNSIASRRSQKSQGVAGTVVCIVNFRLLRGMTAIFQAVPSSLKQAALNIKAHCWLDNGVENRGQSQHGSLRESQHQNSASKPKNAPAANSRVSVQNGMRTYAKMLSAGFGLPGHAVFCGHLGSFTCSLLCFES